MKTLIYILFSTLLVSGLANSDALNVCSDSPSSLVTQEAASDLVNRITADLIQNTQVKDSLSANPSELEKVKEKLAKCSEVLMKLNQYKVIENLITQVLDPLDLDLSNNMRMTGNQIKKDIDTIVNLAHAKNNAQIVTPAFQWVQSKSSVLLQVKFAHRHDAPGCLEVKNEKIEFTDKGLTFTARGVQGMQPMQFKLNLNFYKDIDPEQSTWNLESVGRMFINITKAEPEVWVWLLKDNEKLPQMRLWWEMKDNYKEDMKEYDRLQEEQEDIDKKAKKKKKNKKKDDEDQQAEPVADAGTPANDNVIKGDEL